MLRAFLLPLASLIFLAATPATAQNAQEQAQLAEALARGKLLYEIDVAGWVSTDAMMAKAPEAAKWPIRGWLVEPEPAVPHAWNVVYYLQPGGEGADALPAFRARVENGKVTESAVVPEAERRLLSAAQMRMVRAIEVARKADYKPCTPARFNVTVVPPSSPEAPLEVYLLSAQTETKVFPIGGHYKLVFAPDGTLIARRPFMKSCLNMDARTMPAGAGAASLFVNHLLDPIPTEMHVLSSIQIGTPVFVGTRKKRTWAVTPQGITLMKR